MTCVDFTTVFRRILAGLIAMVWWSGGSVLPSGGGEGLLQQHLSEASWAWVEEEATLHWCLDARCNASYGWRLRRPPDSRGVIEIAIEDTGGVAWSMKGTNKTVFLIQNDHLYYVDFWPGHDGGRLVCVDLARRQKLWECTIGGILNVISKSAYSSARTIAIRENAVWVHGLETYGKFINVVDIKSGKILGERRFD